MSKTACSEGQGWIFTSAVHEIAVSCLLPPYTTTLYSAVKCRTCQAHLFDGIRYNSPKGCADIWNLPLPSQLWSNSKRGNKTWKFSVLSPPRHFWLTFISPDPENRNQALKMFPYPTCFCWEEERVKEGEEK